MILRIILVLLTVTAVLVGYILYYPMPPEITDPFQTTLLMAPLSGMKFLSSVLEVLGYGSMATNIRWWQSWVNRPASLPDELEDVQISSHKLAGVDVVIHRPSHLQKKSPATIYIHGGGWVFAPTDMYKQANKFAKRSDSVVFYIDYRLAPDHPFPAGFDDCIGVARYILLNGDKYGVDAHKVGVAGESAGGNLAAAVALALTKEKSHLPPLKFQVLYVPALQGVDFRTPSYIDMDMPILNARAMSLYYALYFGLEGEDLADHQDALTENRHIPPDWRASKVANYMDKSSLPEVYRTPRKTTKKVTKDFDENLYKKVKDIVFDPRFSPLMADDLSGLPPAFIWTGEVDVLRDDGIFYSRRLEKAGVEVQLCVVKGGTHLSPVLFIPEHIQSENVKNAHIDVFKFVKEHLGNDK